VLYRYKNPLAPAVAERLEGVPISLEEILAHVENQRQGRDYLVVEGAGGLLVPIHGTYSYADLVEEAQLGTLVVVGSRLGAINHAALTFEVLRARRLPVIGYVLSEPHPREVGLGVYTAAETNREIIQRVAARYDVKELGVFPHLSHLSAISGSTVAASTVTGHVPSGAALNGKGNVVEEERGVIKREGARLIEGIESFFS